MGIFWKCRIFPTENRPQSNRVNFSVRSTRFEMSPSSTTRFLKKSFDRKLVWNRTFISIMLEAKLNKHTPALAPHCSGPLTLENTVGGRVSIRKWHWLGSSGRAKRGEKPTLLRNLYVSVRLEAIFLKIAKSRKFVFAILSRFSIFPCAISRNAHFFSSRFAKISDFVSRKTPKSRKKTMSPIHY